ncbi:MAG: PAS domain-containing protein [Candidatus Omnitrophica bacterium]|nr:PAS domain-containing protein [Candidatus Omnitrophota bacterium]
MGSSGITRAYRVHILEIFYFFRILIEQLFLKVKRKGKNMSKNTDKELKRLLDESLRTSEFAWWQWEIPDNKVTFNDLKVTMIGYDPKDFADVGYQAFTDLLHPDDHERAMDAMRDHLEGRAPLYQIDYRIRKADGTYTWYVDRGVIMERSGSGEPLMLRGIVLDLGSELRKKTKDETILALLRKAIPKGREEQLIRICASCKKLKLKEEDWVEVEKRFLKAVETDLSHGICPDCLKKLYPELADQLT